MSRMEYPRVNRTHYLGKHVYTDRCAPRDAVGAALASGELGPTVPPLAGAECLDAVK